jgi:hypothetical protein
MKRLFYSILFLAFFPFILSESLAQKTIQVDKAGTLSTLIDASTKYSIEDLTVTGTLNGIDLALLRDMAGNNDKGQLTAGTLKKLDLSGVTIVAGGKYLDTDEINFQEDGGSAVGDFHLECVANIIPDWCFYACNKLQQIVLPTSVKGIGTGAFMDILLTRITLPDGIETIGDRAFYHDIFLKKFKMPASVVKIGANAFAYCDELTEIDLPAGVESIGKNAFRKCIGITKVNAYMARPVEISEKTFEGVTDKATLNVLKGSGDHYRAAAYWNAFSKISESLDDPTGIQTLKSADALLSPLYTLQGYQVTTPQKGQLYIRDGRKFIYR